MEDISSGFNLSIATVRNSMAPISQWAIWRWPEFSMVWSWRVRRLRRWCHCKTFFLARHARLFYFQRTNRPIATFCLTNLPFNTTPSDSALNVQICSAAAGFRPVSYELTTDAPVWRSFAGFMPAINQPPWRQEAPNNYSCGLRLPQSHVTRCKQIYYIAITFEPNVRRPMDEEMDVSAITWHDGTRSRWDRVQNLVN